ncbi:pilin [Cobetia sp. Dlab-2-AX]|nr:pilin [Cobetia sp. Dlab-2-AX]MCO7235517.1 pilin [Cobetia sp. Dlab-2-U]
MTEGLNLAAAAKTQATEYYSSEGDWPASNTVAGLPTDDKIKGNAVTGVKLVNDTITITYNSKVEDGKTIILKGAANDGSVEWTCTGGTVDAKYRPANCRADTSTDNQTPPANGSN